MKFEEAISYLRKGKRIFREKTQGEYLHYTEKSHESYYLTLWDIIANDWEVEKEGVPF